MANPRKVAVLALEKVFSDKAYSNLTLNSFFKDSDLGRTEKAFASNIFYGVLDRKITLDYFLNKLLKKPIEKASSFTAAVLRAGLYQIIYMDSVPSFSAVDESVKLMKKSKESRNAGLVNAVLRNAIRNGFELPKGNSINDLSVKYSCPEWIIKQFINDYSLEDTIAILEDTLNPAPIILKVNTLKISAKELSDLLEKEEIAVKKTSEADCIEVSGFDISKSELYKKGYFHAQDLACVSVCKKLSPKPNDTVLDICAAPGGKTFTLAEIMQNKGKVLACDLYEHRAGLIEEGAKRLGLDIVETKANDATQKSDLGEFDKVLCDVPCSGLGILRRKPDIKYKEITNFSELEEIQKKILSNAVTYVKNGGNILYSTCTLRKNENEEIVKAFLRDNAEFELEYEHTFLPHIDKTDGFYCALMRKK